MAHMTSKLKAERERQLAGVAELKRKIEDTQAQSERKLAHLRECLAGAEAALAVSEQAIAVEDTAKKVEEFCAVATELDASGESPARLAKFEQLAGELSASKRLALAYEARSMCIRRMRRVDGVIWKAPFPTWAAMAQAWVRPAPAAAA